MRAFLFMIVQQRNALQLCRISVVITDFKKISESEFYLVNKLI